MNPVVYICLGGLTWAVLGFPWTGHGAEVEKPAKEWKDLTPEQRQTKVREFRKRNREPIFTKAEIEARRKEFKSLPPEERRAKIREWRENREGFRMRLESQLLELRQKKSEGTLSTDEAKRLERLEVVAKRFDQAKRRSRPP